MIAIEDFLSNEECQHLIRLTTRTDDGKEETDLMTRSAIDSKYRVRRTSSSLVIDWESHPISKTINARATSLLLSDPAVTAIEPSGYVIRYRPAENGRRLRGESFGLHHDAGPTTRNFYSTLLVYLNTLTEGGETIFPDLGLEMRPTAGYAIWFRNLYDDGSRDGRMKHEAAAPVGATKYACQWIGLCNRPSALSGFV